MRRAAAGAVLALALVGCTKAGPPPPDFYATLEVIRAELTAVAPAPPALATVTPAPTAEPTSAPTATAVPAPTDTPLPTEAVTTPTAERAATPTEAAPPLTPEPSPVQYTVQRGDYLSLIAAQYGVTVEALIAANDIPNPNVIEVGQVLVIPVAQATPAAQ